MSKWNCIFTILILLLLTSNTFGQQNNKKEQYTMIPSEVLKPLFVDQPNCPLKLENFKMYYKIGERFGYIFTITNKGQIPVGWFGLGIIEKDGSAIFGYEANRLIYPNESFDFLLPENAEIIPFSKELMKNTSIKDIDRLQGLILVYITQITDGEKTVFDELKEFDKLEQFYLR